MQRNTWCRFLLLLISAMLLLAINTSTANVAFCADEMESEAEASAEKAYQRYVLLLKRNPQAGVSLDRIYGHHIDRGSLDKFTQDLADAMAATDADGSSAMILGLIESRRGRDAEAVKAFEVAEQKRPEDPMASWHLGQSLVAVGETQAAAAALERSLSKKIPRAVQEKVFQMLGRIYQRNQQPDQAMELWKRFEQAFPNDERVQEQIASIQIEENQLEDALVRYETIAAKASDPYKRVQFGIKAADLKLRLGQTDDGLAAFESLLEELKPSSWLFNDVRDRIEESYLRTDDYAGLVDYYQNWIDSHPDDLDAMSRIGKYLAVQGRADAAEEWYSKAIEKAPSDPKLRLALIEQLIGEQKYPAAIQQYEALAKIDSGNPDHIERWGMLYLRHPDLDQAAQQQKAAEIWERLIKGKEDDAVAVSRVAELFRSAEMTDQAIAKFRKAIELEPQNPQYREYLGEYLHNLQRSDEAMIVWQAMVEGDKRTTQNLTRLSEVYKSFGYIDEALTTLAAACEMDPEFGDLIRFSNMLREARRFDDSLTQLDRVAALAVSAEETQIILEARIKTLSESGQLPAATTALERKVVADSSAQQWRVLAFYQEAMNRLADASRSAAKAVDLEPDSIPAWSVAARVMEKAGLLAEAADANRTLASLDRRFRTQYLKKIAELERRLGRFDNAIQAARDVIASAPGNPESYRFYSDLCFQLGKPDLGLDALRRSVRVNPSDVESLKALADALAGQFKTDEAIELYWRAFQQADKLDGKIAVVQTLADLYVRTNAFDKLVTRLENLSKELSQQRDMTICLANAYQATGDIGLAREQLKGLLKEGSRDVILLDELALLAEQANEYDDAIDYQKQIVELTKSDESRSRLASLLLRSGDVEGAEALWAQSTIADSKPDRQVQSIDDLITAGKLDSARKLCNSLLAKNSEDWDALLRLAIIDWKQDRKDDASKRCDQILAMRQPLDTPSHLKQSRRENNLAAVVARANGIQTTHGVRPTYSRSSTMYNMKNALQIVPPVIMPKSSDPLWTVSDFGECRIAAITIQMAVLNNDAEYLKQLQTKAEATIQQDSTAAWDWWYALSFPPQTLRASTYGRNEVRKVAKLLYQTDEPAANLLYANVLQMALQRTRSEDFASEDPFTELDAAQMVEAWQQVNATHPQWSNYTRPTVQNIVLELKKSKYQALADDLMQSLLGKDARPHELEAALQITLAEGDVDRMLDVTDRLIQLQQATPILAATTNLLEELGTTFSTQAAKLAEGNKDNDWDSIRKLLVKFLDIKSSTFNPLASKASGGRVLFSPVRTTVTTGLLAQSNTVRQSLGGRAAQFNMLEPSKYYSAGDQQFFETLHSIYATRSTAELKTILDDYRTSAKGNQVVFAELALAIVAMRSGQSEQSAVHLVRAAAEVPEDADLRLQLVAYYEARKNYTEALQLLETIDATDQLIVKDKELLVLELATKTGNTDRARTAAERLFGLRLDTDTAIQLSNKMQALGMNEMAASLLSRTRKVAGDNLKTLLALMTRYQATDNEDVACQIAHQILLQTNGQTVSRTGADPEAARKAAVRILAQSGQLEPIIQRTVEQLSRSPKSIRLHQTLLEYYVASGKSTEAAEVEKSLADLTPVTAASLIREGQQLERGRKYSEACDKYLAAFKKDPRSLGQNYFNYLRTFQNAKRMTDLADILLQDDVLSKLQNNYQIAAQTIDYLFRESGSARPQNDKAIELFQVAWKQFPNYRSELISGINSSYAWRKPEMIEYAKEGIIPKTLQQSIATPWKGLAERLSFTSGSTSKVTGTLNRIVAAVSSQPEQQAKYIQEVETAVTKFDKWHGGKVLLAALKASAGDVEAAYRLIEKLENDPEVLFIPTSVSLVLGSELAKQKDLRFTELSIRLLKNSLAKDNSLSRRPTITVAPEVFLAALYSRNGETENARLALKQWIDNVDYSQLSSAQGYHEFWQLQVYVEVAERFLAYGCPFDALEYYRKVTPELEASTGRYVSLASKDIATARMGVTRAMAAMSTDAVLAFINRSHDDASAGLDISLLPRDQKDNTKVIHSVVVDALKQLNRPQDIATMSNILGNVLDKVENLSLLPAIVGVEMGLLTDNSALYRKAMDKLKGYVDQTPPDKANSLREISLWIPARSAFKANKDLEFAEQLASRAQAAAEANEDDSWLISMMQEKGDIAIAAGDKSTAEAAWSRLLDAVLAHNSPPPESAGSSTTIRRPSQTPPSESALDELRKRLLNKPATLSP